MTDSLLVRQLQASIDEVRARKRDEVEEWLSLAPPPERPKRLKRKQMSNALAKVESNQLARSVSDELDTWERMREQAKALVESGFLPRAVNTPEKALAIMQTGKELGLGPMQALRSIHIIEGKPTMSADLIAGLALQRVPGMVLRVAESTDAKCVVKAARSGQELTTFTFTIQDAQRAGLVNKDNWKKYPRQMLRARCITEAARAIAPDAVVGIYDPDELGAVTGPSGEVVDYQAPVISMHVNPGENHDDAPRECPELDRVMATLTELEQAVAKSNPVTWDMICQWRALLGEKGKPSQLGQAVSALYNGDAIAPSQKAAMMKLLQRVNRQVKRHEDIVPKPGPEAALTDDEDTGEL